MNLKYFLRGLGTGIVFGTLIMLVAYMMSGGYKISDEEVIERAKKLGYGIVEQNEKTTDADTEEVKISIAEVTTEDNTNENTSEAVVDTTEDNSTSEATDEITSEDTSEITSEITSEEPTTETTDVQPSTIIKATITVTAGMGSQNVARLLQDAGIIENASDFDSYLMKNGYATKIEIGTYEFNNSMSYQEIAEELTKKR